MSRFKKIYPFALAVPVLLPLIAGAQTSVPTLVGNIQTLFGYAIAIIFGVAAIVFIWGIVSFISKSDNPEERKKARSLIIYGLVAMVVMLGFWGIVRAFTTYFNLGNTPGTLPQIPTTQNSGGSGGFPN